MNSVNYVSMKSRRGLSLLLSICLTFTGFPATLARAQGVSEVLAQNKPNVEDFLPPPSAKPDCKLVGSGGTGPQQKVFEVCPGDQRTQVDPVAAEAAARAGGTPIELDPSQSVDVQKGVARVGQSPPPAESSSNASMIGLGVGVAAILGAGLLVNLMKPKKWCGSWYCTSQACCNVFGGGVCSGNKEFSSESECRGHFSGSTFGKSCHEC